LVAALLLAQDQPDHAPNLGRQAADTATPIQRRARTIHLPHCKHQPQLAEPDTLIELINPEAAPN
jgi:hypothetical protein